VINYTYFNRQEILIHVDIYLHKLENYIIVRFKKKLSIELRKIRCKYRTVFRTRETRLLLRVGIGVTITNLRECGLRKRCPNLIFDVRARVWRARHIPIVPSKFNSVEHRLLILRIKARGFEKQLKLFRRARRSLYDRRISKLNEPANARRELSWNCPIKSSTKRHIRARIYWQMHTLRTARLACSRAAKCNVTWRNKNQKNKS